MSYCVNCGVELDLSAKICPLCNTPVLNPRINPSETRNAPTPFPQEKGEVEKAKRADFTLLLSVILISTGVTCGLLNLLVFPVYNWSIPIIGICALIWIFCIPFLFPKQVNAYLFLFLDGAAIAAYLYLLTYLTKTNRWFFFIGIPITALTTVMAELFLLALKKISASILPAAAYVIAVTAAICAGIEIILDLYFRDAISLSWSAIVLTVCTIIEILLITVLSRKRLRDTVRRRLHF